MDEIKATEEESQESTTFTTFDDVRVSWTQEALDRLNSFPKGHLRRKAHARVEKNARVQQVETVSLAFLEKILNEKIKKDDNGDGNGNSEGIPGDILSLGASLNAEDFNWTPEALDRLERVPKGFMRDNTQNRVMAWCFQNDIKDISLDVCEEGIRESVKMMEDAIKNGAGLEDFIPQKEVKA
jgi:hypothetical protein